MKVSLIIYFSAPIVRHTEPKILRLVGAQINKKVNSFAVPSFTFPQLSLETQFDDYFSTKTFHFPSLIVPFEKIK